MPLSLIAPASGTVVDLASVKAQCRLAPDQTDEDDYLVSVLIPAIVDRAEASTRRALRGPQTWELTLEEFPREGYIELPKPPLVSVSSISYVDTGGVTRTLTGAQYLTQAPAGPRCRRGRVGLPFATIWPITIRQLGAVTVRFVAGYVDPLPIPGLLVSGMLMDAGTLFETRESVLTGLRAMAIPIPFSTKEIYDMFRSYPRQRLAGLGDY